MGSPLASARSATRLGALRARLDKRYRRIFGAVLSAILGKGTAVLVSVITIPLTVRYLGAESYGLWVTISSTVTLFFLFDVGIANTLTNLISEAYALNDKEQAAARFATAFWIVLGIAATLGIMGCLAWPWVHWQAILHVQNTALAGETSRAVAAAFIVFLLALPTGLATKVLAGYQELHAANLFATGGSALSLLVVLTVIYLHGNLTALVAGFGGSTVAANLACMLWICLFHKPWMTPWPRLFTRHLIRRIFSSGTQFFAIQVAGLVVFGSGNVVISHYLSPAEVTPYAVTWRLVSYITVVQAFMLPALWPAYSEAFAKGHLDWIRSTYRRVRYLTIIILTIGCALTLIAGRAIIRIWAGPAATPSFTLLSFMILWVIIFTFTLNQSCLMGATYRVRRQAVFGPIAATANLILSVLWVRSLGAAGVVLATVVSYLIFVVPMQISEVRTILHGDRRCRLAETNATSTVPEGPGELSP